MILGAWMSKCNIGPADFCETGKSFTKEESLAAHGEFSMFVTLLLLPSTRIDVCISICSDVKVTGFISSDNGIRFLLGGGTGNGALTVRDDGERVTVTLFLVGNDYVAVMPTDASGTGAGATDDRRLSSNNDDNEREDSFGSLDELDQFQVS
jgi:hypothetical protein